MCLSLAHPRFLYEVPELLLYLITVSAGNRLTRGTGNGIKNFLRPADDELLKIIGNAIIHINPMAGEEITQISLLHLLFDTRQVDTGRNSANLPIGAVGNWCFIDDNNYCS